MRDLGHREMNSDGPEGHRALIVVDVQPDFLPGGSLAVEGGDVLLPGIERLMTAGSFALQIATQDWHPADHVSFASNHDGAVPFETIELYGHEQVLWPDHCVQGSPGAALHPELPWDRVAGIVRKGMDRRVDSYSGFRNNWNAEGERPFTGLAGYLRERGIGTVSICGLARDVCIRWTAQDAVDAGFETHLLWDLTRSVDPSEGASLRTDLESRGVRIVEGDPPRIEG